MMDLAAILTLCWCVCMASVGVHLTPHSLTLVPACMHTVAVVTIKHSGKIDLHCRLMGMKEELIRTNQQKARLEYRLVNV